VNDKIEAPVYAIGGVRRRIAGREVIQPRCDIRRRGLGYMRPRVGYAAEGGWCRSLLSEPARLPGAGVFATHERGE
jgi:hypothetical protein